MASDGSKMVDLRTVPLVKDETWHVAVRPLRCWTVSDGDDAVEDEKRPLARPWVVFLSNLHPRGRPMLHVFSRPLDRAPDASFVAAVVEGAMECPSASFDGSVDTRPHRPGRVLCSRQVLLEPLNRRLRGIDVVVEGSGDPSGLDAALDKLAEAMIKKGAATIPKHSRGKSLFAITKDRDLVRSFYTAAKWFFRVAPWRGLHERQTLRVTDDSTGVTRWMCVVGNSAFVRRGQGLEDSDIVGVGMYESRWDCEQRLLSTMDTEDRIVKAEANPVDAVCGACGKKEAKKRCTRCRRVFYCSEECQLRDWEERHGEECKECTPVRKYKEPFWGEWEGALLFEVASAIPLAELDDIELQNYPLYKDSTRAFPLPIVFRKGTASQPSKTELEWFTTAMLLLPRILFLHNQVATSMHPMKAEAEIRLGQEEDQIAHDSFANLSLPVPPHTPSNLRRVFRIRTDPILLAHELKQLQKEAQKADIQPIQNPINPTPTLLQLCYTYCARPILDCLGCNRQKTE